LHRQGFDATLTRLEVEHGRLPAHAISLSEKRTTVEQSAYRELLGRADFLG